MRCVFGLFLLFGAHSNPPDLAWRGWREHAGLIDTAHAPIFGVDTLWRVNVWNKCAMRLTGYNTEEVTGRSLVQEFITDDFKTTAQAVLDQALAGDETDK